MKKCLLGHKWQGCVCTRCGAEKPHQHDYQPDKTGVLTCTLCGKKTAGPVSFTGLGEAEAAEVRAVFAGLAHYCDRTCGREELSNLGVEYARHGYEIFRDLCEIPDAAKLALEAYRGLDGGPVSMEAAILALAAVRKATRWMESRAYNGPVYEKLFAETKFD